MTAGAPGGDTVAQEDSPAGGADFREAADSVEAGVSPAVAADSVAEELQAVGKLEFGWGNHERPDGALHFQSGSG